jgi:hypothetical protein
VDASWLAILCSDYIFDASSKQSTRCIPTDEEVGPTDGEVGPTDEAEAEDPTDGGIMSRSTQFLKSTASRSTQFTVVVVDSDDDVLNGLYVMAVITLGGITVVFFVDFVRVMVPFNEDKSFVSLRSN